MKLQVFHSFMHKQPEYNTSTNDKDTQESLKVWSWGQASLLDGTGGAGM